MALFAAALVSLAQMIAAAAEKTGASWEAMRFFTYAAIMLNLGGAFISLVIIKMCSDVPRAAQQKIVTWGESDLMNVSYQPPSIPKTARITPSGNLNTTATPVNPDWITTKNENIPLSAAQGGILIPEILQDHFLLLESFGMSKKYRFVDRVASWALVAACVCTFAALSFWTFLTEAVVTAGVTMIAFGLTAIIVTTVYFIGSFGQNWH